MKTMLTLALILMGVGMADAADPGPDSIYYQKRTTFVGYPPYPLADANKGGLKPVRDFRQSLRLISYAYENVTPAEAEQVARKFYDQGFNLVQSEGNRYVFRESADEKLSCAIRARPFEDVIKNTKIMCDACHKFGLRFFLHMTCTMVDHKLLEKHPDWGVIDLQTGKTVANGYGTATACQVNDDFMNEFLKRLDRLIQETGVDGIMQDEIQFFGPTLCGCRWCREKFKKETGFEIPAKLEGWLHNYTNPSYLAWLEWRRAKDVENIRKVRDLIKKPNPDNTVITYLCNNTTGYGYYSSGLTVDDFPRFADSVGYECEPHDHFYLYYWPHIIYEMKYLRAVAENIGCAPWTLFYDRMLGDHTFNWFLGMSQGLRRYWFNSDPLATRCWEPLLAWEAKHQKILMNVKSAANIGVVFSQTTRDLYPGCAGKRGWIQGYSGTCNALTDGHIPYKAVVDADLRAPVLREKVKTLLLFNTGALSDAAVEAVRSFVKEGGILVASAGASLHDEKGAKRKDFALADVFGCSYAGEEKNGLTLLIPEANDVTGDVTGELRHEDAFIPLKDLAPDVKVIGRMKTTDGKEHPGVLVRNFGKGKVVYFSGHPEYRYFYHYYNECLIKPGEKWIDNRDPKFGQLLCRVATYGNDRLPLVVGNAPQGVVVEAYRHEAYGLKGIQVHLANLLGGVLKEGVVPQLNDISFPEVKPRLPDPRQPITVSVRADKVRNVYLLSPDFDVTVDLAFEKKGGCVTVALPDLYRYFILYFSEDDPAEILKLNGGKTVKTIPPPKKLIIEEKEPLVGKYDPNSVVAFSDSPNFKGGLEFGWYKKEVCQLLYGSQSTVTTATVKLNVKAKMEKPALDIGGMDDNQPASHAPLEIKLNGKTVFKGNNTYPDQEWAVQSFPIEPSDVVVGENTVEIKNTGFGPRGNIPWFGVNFVRLRPGR